MPPRCASFYQKNGRARRQARSGRASAGLIRPVRAAGLLYCQRGSQDDPLSITPSAGDGTAGPAAQACQPAQALWISSPVPSVAPGRRAVRNQPHLPALPRRGPYGAQAPGTTACCGHTGADPGGSNRQRSLPFGVASNACWAMDRWISSTTSSPVAGVSGSSISSTT